MKTTALLFLAASLSLLSFRSDKPAYRLYDASGKNVKYLKMIETVCTADVVFFG